jgi:ketosteroid isomerase-like protein
MKKILVTLFLMGSTGMVFAQSKSETKAEQAVSFLVKALESGSRSDLETIASEELTYGHSNGKIEDKKAFIEELTNGNSDFVSIKTSGQTVHVTGNIALVRHRLDATTLNKGVAGEAHLYVLMVFRKENGSWKLLARQAAKVL